MNTSDLIEKYIQKKATAEELEIIKQLMDRDSEFKSEVSFHLEIRKAIEKEERERLKQRLQSLEQNKQNKRFLSLWWKIAAVFVVGAGLLWLFNQPVNYEKIYVENFEIYPNIVAPTVRDFNGSEESIAKAFNYYDSRNYREAAKAFGALQTEDAHFYYAMSLMGDHQIEKAIEIMKSFDLQSSEKYKNQINWYLALGYLKIRDKEKSIIYLKKVIKNDQTRASDAQKIMLKLK